MTKEELENAMLAKGYVRCADGSWTAPSRITGARDAGQPQQERSGEKNKPGNGTELPRAEFQKLQNASDQSAGGPAAEKAIPHYEAGVSTMDGESRPAFRISITLYVSGGRRDPVGSFETVCDLITITRRRLMERLSGGQLEGDAMPTRRRGRKHRDRETGVKAPPF